MSVFDPVNFGPDARRCSGKDLVKQGFSGAMDIGTVIEFTGSLVTLGNKYDIYYYDHNKIKGNHETRRILVLNVDCKYLGSYSTDIRPSGTSGADILFDVPREFGNVIHFEKGMPPRRVRFGGQVRNLRQ